MRRELEKPSLELAGLAGAFTFGDLSPDVIALHEATLVRLYAELFLYVCGHIIWL